MAVTGIPAPPTAPSGGLSDATPLSTQHLLVQKRARWYPAAFWYAADYLEPISADDVAAPGISQAKFRFHFGRIKREDQSAVSVVQPEELIDSWVRIQLINPHDPQLGLVPNTTLWVGRFTEQSINEMKTLDTGDRQGTIELTAFGLADLLDREPYWRSYVRDAGATPTNRWVDRRLVFNDFRPEGLRQGNRTATLHPDPWEVGRDIHIFDRPQAGTAYEWTAADIVEHLLYTHQQGKGVAGDLSAQTINFHVAGQWDALNQITPVRVDPTGKSIWSTISQVVDRRRGFGASIYVDDATDNVMLHIFTMIDQPITIGTATIPANAEPVSIDLDTVIPQGQAEVSTDATQLRADEIIVQGQYIKSICTVSVADGSLEPGWTAAEETAYKAAAAGTAEENDLARRGDQFARVYSEFVIPDNWSFVSALLPGFDPAGWTEAYRLSLGWHANPFLSDTGEIVPAAPGSILPAGQGQQRGWGVSMLKSMPIRISETVAGVTYDGDGFTEPFVVLKLSSGAYQLAEKVEASPFQIKVLQDRCGIKLESPNRHAIALNQWTGAAASLVEPTYDYDDILATVCLELDSRLQVREIVAFQSLGLTRRGRVMVIDVPDAEFVWIAGGTVLAAKGDTTSGFEFFYTYPQQTNQQIFILRDDSQRLREIARSARDWYVNPRRAVTLKLPRLLPDYKVGMLLETVSQAATFTAVKSVITKVSYDFERMTTALTTGFAELDFTLQ